VLPLPQAVAVQAGQLTNTQQAELQVLASNNKCTGFGGFTKGLINVLLQDYRP